MARPKLRRLTKTFPLYREEPLPEAAASIARDRTAHLETLAFRTPLQDLLVSAYMQGIVDAHSAMTREKIDGRQA